MSEIYGFEGNQRVKVYGFTSSARMIYNRVQELGISCGQLAKMTGVPKTSIESVVYGNVLIDNMQFAYAYRILRALSLDPEAILSSDRDDKV